MDKKDTLLIKKIVSEYTSFVQETSVMFDEVKKATVLALKKVLKLENGETVLINSDGSLEVETKNGKEKVNV